MWRLDFSKRKEYIHFILFILPAHQEENDEKTVMPMVQFITGNFMAEKCFQFIMAVISDIGQKLKDFFFFFSTRSQLGIEEGCNHYSFLDGECLKASYTAACILLLCYIYQAEKFYQNYNSYALFIITEFN